MAIKWEKSYTRSTILYSATQKRTGQFETRFMRAKQIKESMQDCETNSARLCKLRIGRRYRNIAIISPHARTEEEQLFYEYLEETYRTIQEYDIAILVVDFNAKIGKEEHQKKAAGKYPVHDIGIENGNLLGTVCNRKWKEDKQYNIPA
jgi:hypothetical protein